MTAQRPPLDLHALRAPLLSMPDGLAVLESADFGHHEEIVANLLRAGVIQNFEFCFELASRRLKRELERETEDREALGAMAWRDMIRLGAERGLLDEHARRFNSREMRNITLHTYDRAKADRVLAVTRPFGEDARQLLARLEERNSG